MSNALKRAMRISSTLLPLHHPRALVTLVRAPHPLSTLRPTHRSTFPAKPLLHSSSSLTTRIRLVCAMPAKQATLGKFFGGKNDAPTQQTKLAFSSKSKKPEPKEEDDGEDLKEEDAEMADMSSPRANGHATTSRTPRKRTSLDAEDLEGSEDEPPTKKQRSVKVEKSEVKEEEDDDVKPTKRSQKSDASHEDAKPTDDIAKSMTSAATPKKAGKVAVKDEDDEGKHKATNSSPAKAAAAVDADPHDSAEEQNGTDEEVDESEEDEDEKPEVAAKAREKVQTTLSSKAKDPYPDWKPGEPVPYAALCTTFSKIEMTTKRLETISHCSLFMRQVLRLTPNDLLPTVLLMINKLAADYTGIELGIGESLIMKAIGETTGRNLSIIKEDQQKIGDLGLVAAKSRANQPTMFKPKPLTVRGVHEGLMAIATVEGSGAQARKIAGIKKLLSAADVNAAGKGSKGIDIAKDKGGPSEAKFIIRTLEGKMRLGLADKTVLVALAQAIVAHEVSQKNDKMPSTDQLAKGETMLKSVYSELPSYEVLVPAMLEHGIMHLHESCKLRPGVPLKPMLAKPTKSITEVLDRFENKQFTCEYKYDGERAQIHFVAHDSEQDYATSAPAAGKTSSGISNVFSRNSEDLSKKYPDILAALPSWIKEGTKSFVLDCEAVGWDSVEKKTLPFQQLQTRKRKDVKVEDIRIKAHVFAFDLLYLNGEPLVTRPFRERRDLMYKSFEEVDEQFAFAKSDDAHEINEIQHFLDESIKASCEGLMVKMLDGVESNYEPSRRSQNWLKVKKDYLSGVGDSLDLVVLGAYYGQGKRTSVYGAFLLACYDPNTETYETVCNIGTGFSEEMLEQLHSQLSPLIIDKPKPFYSHSSGNKDQPDVWFEATYVWEVKTADLTVSPRYKAAAAELEEKHKGKGISLRFPRFLKIRDDKKPEQATTNRAVAEMYWKQEGVAKNKGPSVDDDFEY